MDKMKNKYAIPVSERITYGFGNLAANLMITTANAFITYFYTDVVGLTISVVGTILLFARLFDGVSDLVMGAIVDKTSSSKGKARPWIKRMIIPYGLALTLLFTSPSFLPDEMRAIYAFVTYVISLAGVYTMTMVPYSALIGTTTPDSKERGYLSTSRTILGFIGAFLVNGVVLKIVEMYGAVTETSSWTKMAATLGLISVVLLTVLYGNSKERVLETSEAISADNAQKFSTMDNAGFMGINIFYAQWILNDMSKVGLIGMLSFAPIIVSCLFAPILLSRFSKRTIMIIGTVISLIGSVILVLFPTNFTMIAAGLVVRGLGIAPVSVASFAMLGDIADYGEWKTGIRSDGIIFAAATFGEKVGSGLGGWILGMVMALGGYVSGAATQSAATMFAIKSVFAYIPFVFGVVSIILIFFYDLDTKLPDIIKDLEARKGHE